MNVTMLIAEYVIIGFQVLIFLTLFILKIEDITIKSFLESQGNSLLHNPFNILIGAIILGLTYLLGMLMDTVWYRVTHWARKKPVQKLLNKYKAEKRKKEEEEKKEFEFTADEFYSIENKIYGDEGQKDRLFRRRGRIRLFRSSMFHILLILGALLLHISSFWIIVLGITIEALVIFAYIAVNREYLKMIVYYKESEISK